MTWGINTIWSEIDVMLGLLEKNIGKQGSSGGERALVQVYPYPMRKNRAEAARSK